MEPSGRINHDGKRRLTLNEWKQKKKVAGEGAGSSAGSGPANDTRFIATEPTPMSPTGSFYDNLTPRRLRDTPLHEPQYMLFNLNRSS